MFEQRIKKIEEDILKISAKNNKVEADKAWETSLIRKVVISLMIYIFASIFMSIIVVQNYLLNAIIPALAFFLSTLIIPLIKNIWIKRVYIS